MRSWPVNIFVTATVLIVLPALTWAEDHRLPDYVVAEYGAPLAILDGALDPTTRRALDTLLIRAKDQADWNPSDQAAADALIAANDPRTIWTIADLQRFAWRPEFSAMLTRVSKAILETDFAGHLPRERTLNTLIAWDMPAYPGYLAHKKAIYTHYLPGLDHLFTEGDIDWQLVDWGGVKIDARAFGDTDAVCHCIPAVDNPATQPAKDATWLRDDDIVFGVEINGEARAYPRRIMEIREMVNDTLGGRDIAMPYCTLCGAAQAYFTDALPPGTKRPVLRTSGLLIRSNKVMYDIETGSVFDTFKGSAVTGPLADIGLTLEKVTVITSDWGSWRRAFPDTTVLVEDLALGRDFNLRETRDAGGPIFPVGDVDPRLPVHEDIIGVLTHSGQPVAFPRAKALAALLSGSKVTLAGISLNRTAGGLSATARDVPVPSHEAFWFAWAQFHPGTLLWEG
ncbi:MAG: DUF3179 domain-containing (seleno)protein [Pseudomonadota bacterium]